MNILQVLSQYEVTGAETFAAALADRQIAEGHTVFIISDNFFTQTNATVVSHPIGKRDIPQRWNNVQFLRRFIREHSIDVVHAHSRAASWVSYAATRRGTVPLVSSIHGRQHLHFSSKLFSIYGEKRVAVCKSIYDHLNHDLKYSLDTLSLVHNGIDLTRWTYRRHQPPKRKKKIVSFVGRLSGFKGDTLLILVQQVFPEVFRKYADVEFHIIGGMNEQSKIHPAITQSNTGAGKEFILAKGFSTDVERVYRESDLIIGSGRVAMEALACGTPVVSIGESNFVGTISDETKSEALITNFGDLDARRPIDVERSVASILSVLQHPETFSGEWGRKFIEEHFEITSVTSQLYAVYAEAIAKKKQVHEIPVLAYHRVSDTNVCADPKKVKHRQSAQPGSIGFPSLFRSTDFNGSIRSRIPDADARTVYSGEFEAQMTFLSVHGFSPLTLQDMEQVIACTKSLPKKPVVITFGAHEDNYRIAGPVLQRHHFSGVFFLQTENRNPGRVSLFTSNSAKEASALGFEIGSASITCPKMNLLTEEHQRTEIDGSKRMIEKTVGCTVRTFQYPHGYVSEQLKRLARESGYRFAVCLDEGRRNFWIDPLKIRRIQIFAGASKFSFWKKTSGWYLWYKYVY